MLFENMFSLAGLIAMAGWLLLLLSPLTPKWSDCIAGVLLPLLLSLGYLVLLIVPASSSDGGFGTLADVMELFRMSKLLWLAGSTSWHSISSLVLGPAARRDLRE